MDPQPTPEWRHYTKGEAAGFAFVHVLFISLPALIYVLLFVLVSDDLSELAHKPEWMFIALMLEAEAVRELTLASGSAPHSVREVVTLVQIVLLLVCAIVLFATLARYEGLLKGSSLLDWVQWGVVPFSALSCGQVKYLMFLRKRVPLSPAKRQISSTNSAADRVQP